MVSLNNWWTLPRKKHKPTSWSPLYTVYFTLMDLGESNKFIINRSTPISTFLSSRILHESKKNTIENAEFLLGVLNFHNKKHPSFQNTTVGFIHSSMIHLNYHLMKEFPSFHACFLPGHMLATCSFGHGQRNQWCKQYEARIAFGTRKKQNPQGGELNSADWSPEIHTKWAPLHLAKMYSKWR